jgi:predicted short-subunit dehydrogenase-like oxidoreductase (DUF2520 family)
MPEEPAAMARPLIGFVGAGRVGLALSRALARAGEPVVAAFSRSRSGSSALAASVPGCRAVLSLQQLADSAELVFLCVPDDAIEAVASSIRWRPGQAAVHCSGAAERDVLTAAERQGAQTGSFHPLQLFADPEVALRGLSRCAIALDAEPPLLAQLERLVHALGARVLRVPPGKRAAYHAGSHYAAAFLCVLLAEGAKILNRLGIDETEASQALMALATGTLEAAGQSGPARAMAGVYARGDIGSATRHIEALRGIAPDAEALYRMLAERSIGLAYDTGRIRGDQAEAMRRLVHP